ncbi:MAG: DNA replication and repair protein RecF [Chitinophagaceae bacterium]|nr:DNA replication and repair protein RecF [Chitinophagaceae bacterium]
MLLINSISLVQFKNYPQRNFSFSSRIVGISGPNGTGKTNLLDAIYYLCFTKSYFTRSDSFNALTGTNGFRIEGQLEHNGENYKAVCILRETGKKEFMLNGNAYERFSHHIGRFPCVFIAPDDVRMITEGSEERRRFIDAILSQLDPEYLQRLMNYNKLLLQRNSYLKSVSENRLKDTSLLEVYDEQLSNDGSYIFEKRKSFMDECLGLVTGFYGKISGAAENIELKYESQLHKLDFAELLKSTRDRDLYLQRTTAGIHKDDIQILLNNQPFRNIASQGQRKSLLFALKLSEFEMLRSHKGFAPILLLDDVFEKLDESRMHNLLSWVCLDNDGQIFITDTHQQRIKEHLETLGALYQLIEL